MVSRVDATWGTAESQLCHSTFITEHRKQEIQTEKDDRSILDTEPLAAGSVLRVRREARWKTGRGTHLWASAW